MFTRFAFTLAVAILCVPHSLWAKEDGAFRLGLLAGQVALLGDVGNADSNGVGLGATGGVYVSPTLALEASYLSSSHTDVDHNELSFGANYDLGDYTTGYPNLVGGVTFISNKLKPANVTGDGFGLYAGGGWDFELSPQITAGLQARYNLAFEGKTRVNGVDVTTVDDSVSVLLRFLYYFDSAE
ncbi:MAG: porin family protein [Bdellovibrionaceae bacterium]|nr:porin family protein [Pseudobdellovibrionaceae bacterium]